MKVNPIDVDKGMNVIDLLDQFDESGVLGAGKVARACNILAEMIQDEDMNVFLSLGGPLIPGGMRNIVSKMIKEGHVNLIVSSGANITHDLVEAFGGSHYRHEGKDDEELNEEGIGRIVTSKRTEFKRGLRTECTGEFRGTDDVFCKRNERKSDGTKSAFYQYCQYDYHYESFRGCQFTG